MSLTMELLDDAIKVTYEDESGAINSKLVDPGDLSAALAQQTRVETGLLPRNTRMYTRSEGSETVAIEFPAHIRTVFFQGQPFKIPIPDTLHILHIVSRDNFTTRELSGSSLFALKVPLVSMDTPVFRFPFGNVYYGGDVCWGSVRRPVYRNLYLFSAVPELFFSSNFNGDLDTGNFVPFDDTDNNLPVVRGSHLMRYLNGKEEFPVDVLIPSGSLKDVLRR